MTSKTDTPKQAAAEATGLPKVSESELSKAQKEGVLDAEKEAAKDSYRFATDGNLPSPSAGLKYPGSSDIMQWEPLLRLGIEEFGKRIAEGAEPPVPEEKVAGLLGLERSGQNRTLYVRALCDRLDVKSPYEVTDAGPDFTNDATPVSKL